MSAVFHYSFSTVMPIILLILVGVLARHRGYLDVSAFRELNRFNFRYALFARVFVSIYQIESIHDMPVELAVFAVVSLFVLLLFGIVFSKAATKERFRRGVLIQSAFRSNYAVIGMPVAEALVGTPGMQLAAFLQLPVITFFNLVSVIVLSIFSDPEAQQRFYPEDALTEEKSPAGTNRGGAGKMLKGIAANPLIQGVLLGFVALIIRQLLPCRADGEILFSLRRDLSWLYSAILSLSRTATPMALIILGGQLELKEIEDYRRELISGVADRLCHAVFSCPSGAARDHTGRDSRVCGSLCIASGSILNRYVHRNGRRRPSGGADRCMEQHSGHVLSFRDCLSSQDEGIAVKRKRTAKPYQQISGKRNRSPSAL